MMGNDHSVGHVPPCECLRDGISLEEKLQKLFGWDRYFRQQNTGSHKLSDGDKHQSNSGAFLYGQDLFLKRSEPRAPDW